jgi:hypothetical protein
MSPDIRSCLGCLTGLVLLVLAGASVYYGEDWFKQQKAADPTNARYAEVGDCLVKSPTPEFPDHGGRPLQEARFVQGCADRAER